MAEDRPTAPALSNVSTEALVRGLLDAQSNLVLLLDPTGVIVDANTAAAEALGVGSVQDVIGRDVFAVMRPDVPLIRRTCFDLAIAAGCAQCAEDTRRERRIRSTVCPIRGAGGRVDLVAVVAADVTEQVRTEEALKISLETHRALFDHTAEGIALHRLNRGPDGQVVDYTIVDINPQYEAILGLRRDDVVGRLASEVYGVSPAPYLAEFSSAPLTGKPLRFETYFAQMGKHFSISVAPLGPDGFATIFFDVTAIKRSKEEQEALGALVENSAAFTGLATLDGRVIYLNEAGRRLAGLDLGQSLDGLSIFDFVPAADRQWLADNVLPVVRSRGAWTGQGALLNLRTGAALRADCNVFVIPSRETGQPVRLAAVMHDITERERAREQHERLEEQFRQAQKMESVGRLAGGVAHDFNNLLTVILGNVESVLDELVPVDPVHKPLTEVQRAGESAALLTRQLLAFSRKQMIEPTAVNLNRLIANMEGMLRRIIGEDVVLETRPSPEISNVHADAGQLEQVIVNLSVNARDAMPDGGHLAIETADVEVGEEICRANPAARPGRFVRLAFRDSGLGMSDDAVAHAFEPFFTTKPKGTGLGLAMVYGAVSQHGGFVGLTSEVGHGTTVEVYLPATPDAADTLAARGTTESAPGAETVILVEDEPLVRELTERALNRHGYRVLAFPDGASALAAAAAFPDPLHLLLTDVIMPGMNGRELAARMEGIRPGIKTLFTSGHTDDVMLRHGLLEPGLQFIAKPYTPNTLAAKVRAVLDAG
jgi:PAS domain S-box-containing protein